MEASHATHATADSHLTHFKLEDFAHVVRRMSHVKSDNLIKPSD